MASGCGEQEVGVACGSGWNLWVLATGCGCKEVYRFPHTTYPYYILLYLFIFVNVFRSLYIIYSS